MMVMDVLQDPYIENVEASLHTYFEFPHAAILVMVVIEVASLLLSSTKAWQRISKLGTKPRRSELKID
jgi:hypothetical protein